jgi:hypothetical protein
VIRSSWAVQDSIDLEDARMAMASLVMPGSRDQATYLDQPSARTGFRPGFNTDPGKVAASNVSTLNVSPFQLVLPVQRAANGGAYLVTSDEFYQIQPLNVAPAHGTYSRIDRIVIQQSDMYYGDADSNARITLVVGTPSASPLVPTVTGSPAYLELARYTLAPNTTDMTKVTITDMRGADKWTVASGGVLPVPTTAARNLLNGVAWLGLTVYNQQTKAVETYTAANTWSAGMQPAIIINGTSPANVPVQVDGQLYRYQGDLWVWSSGALAQLTFSNSIANQWMGVASYGTGFTYLSAAQKPGSRMVGPDVVQMCGIVKLSTGAGINGTGNGIIIARLYSNHRPATARFLPVACGIVNGAPGAGMLSVTGNDDAVNSGQLTFYTPDAAKLPTYVSLQGVQFHVAAPAL